MMGKTYVIEPAEGWRPGDRAFSLVGLRDVSMSGILIAQILALKAR